MDKDPPDPGGHGVGLGGPEVNIEYHYGNTDAVITTTHSGWRRRVMLYLKVSKIMVKRTNLPNKGTTREVGGIISARRRKNTVSVSKMLMDKLI